MNAIRQRLHLFLVMLATVLTVGTTAHAIIGRPLTPMSYAGVARRTVRRSAYMGAAYGAYGGYGYGGYGAYAAPVAAPVPVTAVPVGCAVGVPCGGVVYQPAYSGANVVYVPQ